MTDAKSKRLIENPDGTYTLPLLYPIKSTVRGSDGQEREEEKTELTFRRLKGGDIRALGNVSKQGDQFATVIVRLAGITMHEFDKLDAKDLMEVEGLVEDFLPEHLKTGATT